MQWPGARKAFGVLLPLVALGALSGMWWTAQGAERALQRGTDAALARAGADFLTVVTPHGAIGEFDPVRLLSGANALANSSVLPGGMQVVVGNTPLVSDTVHLLPLADSVLLAMDRGRSPVLAETPMVVASFVPLRSREGHRTGGWLAVWNAFPVAFVGAYLRLLFLLVAAGIMVSALLCLPGRRLQPRWLAVVGTALGVLLLTVILNQKIDRTIRAATALRLETVRRLVEIAATAPGVRQATVSDVAASVEVRPLAIAPPPGTGVSWSEDSAGPVATILAATPRTLSGLALVLRPREPDPDLVGRGLWGWCGLVLATLLGTLLLSGLSPSPAVFHSGAGEPPRTTSSEIA